MADREEYRLQMDAPEPVDWQAAARPAEGSLFQRPAPLEGRVMAQAQPEPRQEKPADRYGVFAFGTNDWSNPKAAVSAAQDIYANARSMGMTPVFVLPNASHEKFAPVHNALRSFAEERGIQYEVPAYESKDPLHLTRQSAQAIAKKYPDAFVGGDSNSVRLHNWGYGRKLADQNTYVDPRTGQILSQVGAPSGSVANWLTQYRKMLERGQFKKGGSAYPLRDHTDWEEALDYEKRGGKLTHMTPQQFLARVKPLEMNDRDKRLIAHFEQRIKSGVKLDPVAIKPSGKPNGRHRATAAKNLGIETIPVIIFPKRGKADNGRAGYADRGRVIPEMENPSEALEMGGMRPVGPTLGDVYAMPAPDQEVPRPMVSAAPRDDRLTRASNIGFNKEVYHATRATEPIEEFRMTRGPQRHDLLGVHVGTLQAAEDRLRKYFGKDYGMKSGVANEWQAPSIMPLAARMENPFAKKSGEPFTESELRRQVTLFAQKNNLKPDSINAKIAFEKYLKDKGYDHIPYVNSVEDRGNVSYLMLRPENLRSRWAEFDPEKSGESGLGKKGGGSVVKQALMVVSTKAKRHRGRPV